MRTSPRSTRVWAPTILARPRGPRGRGGRARAIEPLGHAERSRRCRQDQAGRGGRRRARGRASRRSVDRRARAGRRAALGAGRDRDPRCSGSRRRATPLFIDTVADALAGRRLLLVVDNCEHVLGAAAVGHPARSSTDLRASRSSPHRVSTCRSPERRSCPRRCSRSKAEWRRTQSRSSSTGPAPGMLLISGCRTPRRPRH